MNKISKEVEFEVDDDILMESSNYNENVPRLKDKIDRTFATEMFHFFLTSKEIILPYNLVHKVLIKTKKMLEENIKSSVINLDMSKKSKDTKLIVNIKKMEIKLINKYI
ncbi:hypothetical protein C923_05333 [Plasmodium falciparum UGT5.1]|uniref:Uncharacterized protein n=1 Tax=Plasmodium falciparum UGT5.1 TaxID=1237627 RepID=W7JH87_PLAFA|nr:hypothetical protein C923_05333 [Plasmodium falciparum UGT5.1]